MLTVLGMYGYYRAAVKYDDDSTILAVLPFWELALLFGCVAVNIGFMGKMQYDKCKENSSQLEKAKK
jgi:hypothetical protein